MKSEGSATNEVIWTSSVQLPHLSHEECLPVIGSCQVSSILSTLETTEKMLPNTLELTPNLELNVLNPTELKLGTDISTNQHHPHHLSHTEAPLSSNFIIIKESSNSSINLPNATATTITAATEFENVIIAAATGGPASCSIAASSSAVTISGINGTGREKKRKKDRSKPNFEEMLYFSCNLCPFLCTKDIKISEHIENIHRNKKNLNMLQLKCPACSNIFYHKIPLKSHLIHDHEVTSDDISKIIQAVMYFSKKDQAARAELENSKMEIKDLKLNDTQGGLVAVAATATDATVESNEELVNNGSDLLVNDDENTSDILEQAHTIVIEPMDKPTPVLLLPTIDISQKNTEKMFSNIIKQKNPVTKMIDQKKTQKCTAAMCKVRLMDPEKMSYHIRSHTEHGFICVECNLEFAFWKPLTSHLWRMHRIDMELFSCDQCDYKSYSLGKLNNIHKLIHSNVKSFSCDQCSKAFKNRKQLRNHKKVHKEKPQAECEECNKCFSDKRQLKIHQDGVHSQIKPFLCSYCGYKGVSKSALKVHTRIHTGEKPFVCNLCDYATGDHNSIRRHKLRHTGQKPYKCKHCDYACIQSSTYKAHLKTKHPGLEKDLMFSCKFCQYRSINHENYLTHVASVHKISANDIALQQNCTNSDSGNEKQLQPSVSMEVQNDNVNVQENAAPITVASNS